MVGWLGGVYLFARLDLFRNFSFPCLGHPSLPSLLLWAGEISPSFPRMRMIPFGTARTPQVGGNKLFAETSSSFLFHIILASSLLISPRLPSILQDRRTSGPERHVV